MNAGIKLRLAALGLAVGLMGPLIVLITLQAQKKADDARARLSQVDTESFEIDQRFRTELRKVNDKARLYATTEEPAVWEDFIRASARFKTWMGSLATNLASAQEKELMTQLDAAYTGYMRQAWALHSLMQSDHKSDFPYRSSTVSLSKDGIWSIRKRRWRELILLRAMNSSNVRIPPGGACSSRCLPSWHCCWPSVWGWLQWCTRT
jgi:hypothetical protein